MIDLDQALVDLLGDDRDMAVDHPLGMIEHQNGLGFRAMAAVVMTERVAPPSPGVAGQFKSGNLMNELDAIPRLGRLRRARKDGAGRNYANGKITE
jgi:hypothetical protein